ncbi:MAG TPA: hypothetical protein VL282_17210 [Tepidisphaeraceae bacterium]|nr:hypothetical protein [Tepidisphaeraceae bacterium]
MSIFFIGLLTANSGLDEVDGAGLSDPENPATPACYGLSAGGFGPKAEFDPFNRKQMPGAIVQSQRERITLVPLVVITTSRVRLIEGAEFREDHRSSNPKSLRKKVFLRAPKCEEINRNERATNHLARGARSCKVH